MKAENLNPTPNFVHLVWKTNGSFHMVSKYILL